LWFNYGVWIRNIVKTGRNIWIYGTVGEYNGNLQMAQPQVEEATEEETTDDFWKNRKVLPIYRLTANLTQNILRSVVFSSFEKYHNDIDETLPQFLIEKYKFLDRKTALQKMHFTLNPADIPTVKNRFVYEEYFYLQLMITKTARVKTDVIKSKKHVYQKGTNQNLIDSLKSQLPFTLTNAQKRVINEIFVDMTSEKPMNRLLQGDVGAGKTIVTIFAILLAIENGYQAALIAPTEILAEQHYKSIGRLLESTKMNLNICLIKGGQNKQKRIDKERIKSGEIHLAIGTHALFQKDVEFKNLSIIVIDEQHRFGVAQRAELSLRHESPDLLYLSATPIPRSLAMTIFGDMSVSSIDELPPTRKPVKTVMVLETKKDQVYHSIKLEIEKGRQIYIVCPLIEESEKMDLLDAETLFENISKKLFPMYSSAILHGRMKQNEKEQIMRDFSSGKTKILVSTTVIEVGIDVPNATVMMIEHAERFGLAQLHQLRGRVGRGADQSYCYLVAYTPSEIGRERLNTMVRTNDGFVIAEKDLELRGPGDVFGTNQSGLPEFKFANLINDQDWLHKAKIDAQLIIDEDPDLQAEKNSLIKNYYQKHVIKKESYSQF
jgi:ATP-dependent DNA helicase RecG